MKYADLRRIDVGQHIKKKNGLSYLSWAWAADELLQADPSATWEYLEPTIFGKGTVMVSCRVTAFGKSMTAQLPVMNHKNQAIPDPDAFAVNTAMQRCLVKAIALHGLGLYIYAGEDLPPDSSDDDSVDAPVIEEAPEWNEELVIAAVAKVGSAKELRELYKQTPKELKESTLHAFTERAAEFEVAA
jgi:hypothetical protein